ncbi:Diphthine--ammonia ligase [Nymphon striatum]|nr:Diphthine--ammonia ligase [Nymphon striatum]
MKVVALISGGKDSCYNMMQCVADHHEIVALANLYPVETDELDSYMYQTVGHNVIQLFAQALGDIPLYRAPIKGKPVNKDMEYSSNNNDHDEVEDLFQLLSQIMEKHEVEAVSVGAIFSDYQRIRVENICARLNLKMLAYLWHREQEMLLKEMAECKVKAIIIKVAAMGLNPKHLGLGIDEIFPHMVEMRDKYGLNICGEGGEFETLTLDCPLFVKSIKIDEKKIVIHSDDAFAPVGYLTFLKMHLEDKNNVVSSEYDYS